MQFPVAPLARTVLAPYVPHPARPSAQKPCHPRQDRSHCETRTPILPGRHLCFSLASRQVQGFDDPAATAPRLAMRDANDQCLLLTATPSQLLCPTPEKYTAAFAASRIPQSRSRKSIPVPARSADHPPDIPSPASRIWSWPLPDKWSRALRCALRVPRASARLEPTPSGGMASMAIPHVLSGPGQSRETNSAMKKLSAPTRTPSSCSFHPQTAHRHGHPRESASPAFAHK